MATNTNIVIDDIPHRAMDVNIVGSGNSDGGETASISVTPNFIYQVAAAGTVGSNLDVTPTEGNLTLYSMLVSAPLANDDATLKIYKDSVAGANLIFDGYLANRDSDGAIHFPSGEACTTKFIVLVVGGSGDLFALARYK